MTEPKPLIGHADVMERLAASRAPVLHLAGPPSVGKRLAAEHYVSRSDELVMVHRVEKPTADLIRETIRWAGIAPPAAMKAAIISADEGYGLPLMLSVLESPPPWTVFLVVGSRELPAPVASRAERHQFGLLADSEVAQVLVSLGLRPEKAAALAPYGRGRVGPALAMDGAGQARACVQGVLRAIISRNPDQAMLALKEWDGRCQELLHLWCSEAASGQWRIFSLSETPGLSAGDAVALSRSVLAELGSLGIGSPRLAAQIVLEPRSRP